MSGIDELYYQNITKAREHLIKSALSYITTGRGGTQQDRLRIASDLAGVPIRTLESELETQR